MKISSRPEESLKAPAEPGIVAVRGVLNHGTNLGSIDITTTTKQGTSGNQIYANGELSIITDIIFAIKSISEGLGAQFVDHTIKF